MTTILGTTEFLEDFRDFFDNEVEKENSPFKNNDIIENANPGDGRVGDILSLLSVVLVLGTDVVKDLIVEYLKNILKKPTHAFHDATLIIKGPSGELTISLNNLTLEEIVRLIKNFQGEIIEIENR